jgi:hypothetical protein
MGLQTSNLGAIFSFGVRLLEALKKRETKQNWPKRKYKGKHKSSSFSGRSCSRNQDQICQIENWLLTLTLVLVLRIAALALELGIIVICNMPNLFSVILKMLIILELPEVFMIRSTMISTAYFVFDHRRDHPGKYLYYVGTFWLYLHSHFRLRNVILVCVLCAYNWDLTMALVWPRWRKKNEPPCAW